MMTKVYYVENNSDFEEVYNTLRCAFTCTIVRTLIEMNYSQIEVMSDDINDFVAIERTLAPFV